MLLGCFRSNSAKFRHCRWHRWAPTALGTRRTGAGWKRFSSTVVLFGGVCTFRFWGELGGTPARDGFHFGRWYMWKAPEASARFCGWWNYWMVGGSWKVEVFGSSGGTCMCRVWAGFPAFWRLSWIWKVLEVGRWVGFWLAQVFARFELWWTNTTVLHTILLLLLLLLPILILMLMLMLLLILLPLLLLLLYYCLDDVGRPTHCEGASKPRTRIMSHLGKNCQESQIIFRSFVHVDSICTFCCSI